MASLPTLQSQKLARVLLAQLLCITQIVLVEVRLWKCSLAPAAILVPSLTNFARQLADTAAPILHMLWVESFDGLGLGLSTLSSFAK